MNNQVIFYLLLLSMIPGPSIFGQISQLEIPDIDITGGRNLVLGDNVFFSDIDENNTFAVHGLQNEDRAGVRLGSGGPTLFGKNNNLGLGTSDPQKEIHIYKAGGSTIRLEDNVAAFWDILGGQNLHFRNASGNDIMLISAAGNVGIGDPAASSDKLFVNGRIRFGDTEYLEAGGSNQIIANGSIEPAENGSYSFGNASKRWNTIFATNGTINTSDKREKTNIEVLSYGLEEVLAFRPVSFNWKEHPEQGGQVGLIAQEANKIIPEVVFDPHEQMVKNDDGAWVNAVVTEDARFGINYALLTPVLIHAIQEQQSQIEELKKQVDALAQCDPAKVSKAGETAADLEFKLTDLPKLYPNVPNPFGERSKIRLYLPETVGQATLHIFDLRGNLIRESQLAERGDLTVVINGNEMMPGMYIYTLIADEKEIDSRRMILTK